MGSLALSRRAADSSRSPHPGGSGLRSHFGSNHSAFERLGVHVRVLCAMLEEVFRIVAVSAASSTEKKFLRRQAVEAALAGGGRSHIRLVQEVLAATGTCSVQDAKQALKSRGGTEEASRLGRLSKLRNAEAHLDCSLLGAAAAVMARAVLKRFKALLALRDPLKPRCPVRLGPLRPPIN